LNKAGNQAAYLIANAAHRRMAARFDKVVVS